MGICLSNQIKAGNPLHTGIISSKNVSGNWTELSNPSSKASSASIPPASTPWSEDVISSRNVSRDGAELSNPSSKASSTSIPQIPRSEGVISSINVSGDGTELSSEASSTSIPQIPRKEGVISSEYVRGKGTELNNSSCKAATASIPPIPRSEGEILQSSNLKSITFSDLETATRNFCTDNVLGEERFGSVFKGWVHARSLAASKCGLGMVVAVKRLNPEGWQGHKERLAKINYLGQLRHPNLVKLIGYCLEDCHRLLVYEFMPNGCMENHLFMRGSYFQPLSWNLRMKIARGSARGLAFLHSAETRNHNAKISDFGLARDEPTGDKSHVSTRVKGTHGYAAPEYLATGHLYAKSDVYSFGVVPLEILSGKKVIDKNRPSGEHDLVEWAKPYLINKRRMLQILDPFLEGQYLMGQALKAATLAFQCLSAEPKLRPNMDEVVTALEQVQELKDT